MNPRARKAHLTVCQLADETLVYDHDRHRAHCLNAAAALVWKHCDGETSLEALESIVSRELRVERAGVLVGLALEQLSRRHLIEEPIPLAREQRSTRREALRQLALVAALPVILTVATRTAAQSLSEGSGSDPTPSASSAPTVTIPVTVNVNVASPPSNPPRQPAVPCRTKGQSCLAAATGQQGTCCAGLTCVGVAQGAGVCA